MEKYFKELNENIRLLTAQVEDAKTKYSGVCEKLHKYYYEKDYDGSTKFLFGSYKNKTNIRPLTPDQDVDVLFKMPEEEFEKYDNYESNGQAALLQKIREILKEKYTTTDKISAWGKVVLVVFSNHNVEVLPAWEQEDGTFTIPNSEGGGSWETFKPRKTIEEFQDSNNANEGVTAELIRMIKRWRNEVSTCNIRSFKLEQEAINFLNSYDLKNSYYGKIFFDFVEHLEKKVDNDNKGHVETAKKRAEKALNYEDEEKYEDACNEWRKIFGNSFPVYKKEKNVTESKRAAVIIKPERPWSN